MAILHLDITDFGTSWLVLVSFNKLLFNISQCWCGASMGDTPSVDKKYEFYPSTTKYTL